MRDATRCMGVGMSVAVRTRSVVCKTADHCFSGSIAFLEVDRSV